jgi:hypothetical protein
MVSSDMLVDDYALRGDSGPPNWPWAGKKGEQDMRTVEFGLDAQPASMIEEFLSALEEEDAVMARLLREALEHLMPLPPSGQERSQKRQEANSQVAEELDQLALSENGGGQP